MGWPRPRSPGHTCEEGGRGGGRGVRRATDPDAYLYRILINASNRTFRRRVTEQPGDPPDTVVPDHADQAGDRAELLAALRELPQC